MTNSSLPLLPPPPTATQINQRFALGAEGDLRVIYLYGQPLMEFHNSDAAGRDVIVVQLCEHGGITEEEAARAFGISRPTVSRAKRKYGQGGVKALIPDKRGPKGPSKIKEYKERLMIALAQKGGAQGSAPARIRGIGGSSIKVGLGRTGG
jgi:transposase-like protein